MNTQANPPYTFGDRTFPTKGSVRQYFLNRLIGMEPGDRASEEDSDILRGLLKLHTNRRDFGLFSDERATFGVGTTGRGTTPKAFFVESGRFRAQVSIQGCLYEGVAAKNPFPAYGLTVADVAAAYPTPIAEEIFAKRCEACNSYQDAHLEEVLEVTRDHRDACMEKNKLLIEDNNTLHAKLQHLVGLHSELHKKADALGLMWAQEKKNLNTKIFNAKISLNEAYDKRDNALSKLEVAETYAGWARIAVEDRDILANRVDELETEPNDYEALRERLVQRANRVDELELEIAAVRYSAKMYKKGAESEIHRYNTQLEQAEKRVPGVQIGALESEKFILNNTVDHLNAELEDADAENVRLTAVVNSNSVKFNSELREKQDKINAQGKELRAVREAYRNGATFLSTKLLEAQDALIKRDSGASGLLHDLREEFAYILVHGVRKSLGIPSFSDAIKLAKHRLTGR